MGVVEQSFDHRFLMSAAMDQCLDSEVVRSVSLVFGVEEDPICEVFGEGAERAVGGGASEVVHLGHQQEEVVSDVGTVTDCEDFP